MNVVRAILYVIAGVGSLILMTGPFTRSYRDASLWLRSAFIIASLLFLAWSTLGLFLLSHQSDDRSESRRQRFGTLYDIKSDVGAVGAGFLLAVGTSPEFRRCSARRSKASNQSLR